MTHESAAAPMQEWTVDGIPVEVRSAIERIRRSDDVVRVAVLPDVHVAGASCVGVAVATKQLLYPALVGQDVGCGLATVALDADAASLNALHERLLGTLMERVPIIRHRKQVAPDLPDVQGLTAASLRTLAAREGRLELGTLGRGNHFIEFERDGDDRLWLMVHSGSRVMGEAITAHHVQLAQRRSGGLVAHDLERDQGRAYLLDLEWARRYAAANRRAMIANVVASLRESLGVSADWATFVDCDHNHVEPVAIDGQTLLVHRKGASSALAGLTALIPGAMGRDSFHVEGRGVVASLHSSSHGAGRVMSRGRARRRIGRRVLDEDLAQVTVARSIRGRLAEESPSAYRDVHAVMRAQRELVRIRRVVRGFIVHRAVC